jgi:hypothetical protein
MITRQLVKTVALPVSAPADAAKSDPYTVDAYFTDGFTLFRLGGWLSRPTQPALAELEDCRTLHCVLLERDELIGLRLRPVVAA